MGLFLIVTTFFHNILIKLQEYYITQHNLFGQAMPLVLELALYYANSIINSTIAFLDQDDQNEMQYDILIIWCL